MSQLQDVAGHHQGQAHGPDGVGGSNGRLNNARTLVASRMDVGADELLETLDLDAPLGHPQSFGSVSRVCFATALSALLFNRLLKGVPTGAAFVADQRARGQRIRFDHGALRTVRFPQEATGALPPGQEAFARILKPLGYNMVGTYPLPRLKMTGQAWAQRDFPEDLPQFFVSELHVEQFDPEFGEAAKRVFGNSRDPIDNSTRAVLRHFERGGVVTIQQAARALRVVLSTFSCRHEIPNLADYELLLNRSPEAGWMATEGNAFNHATSRVPDVELEAERQRGLGRPVKDRVEVSRNGRVRQTAFHANKVLRSFRDGGLVRTRAVPGCFYEIISRDVDPATGRLDLSFDSANATGIFAMTRKP